MKAKLFFLLVFTILSSSCKAQNIDDLIVGEWKEVQSQYVRSGKIGQEDGLFQYTKERYINKTIPERIIDLEYSLQDSVIVLEGGYHKYKIEKINLNEMVLLEYTDDIIGSPFQRRFFYKRMKN